MRFVSGIAAACFVLVVFTTDEGFAATWSYDGENGPHFWHQLFPQACSGKHQSPINIHPASTRYDPGLNDFAMWHDPPRPGSTLIITNSGHTVQVSTKGEFYVANGGLPYVYRITGFHFHWGHVHHHGSEHLIDNTAFPLELHIVSYNSHLYNGMKEAVKEKQGLAILAVLFEISDKDNKDLEPIIRTLKEVKDPEAHKKVEIAAMSLRKLLPQDSSDYYRYNGSVTTPGCFESVVWTVFAKPRPISHRQMHKFRQLLQPGRFRVKSGHRSRRSSPVTSHDYDIRPLTLRQRRRERRAVSVLDELALSRDQTDLFRKDLVQVKEQAVAIGKMNERNAGQIYRKLLDAVHKTPAPPGRLDEENDPVSSSATPGNVSEVEREYIQESLVNNFRSVQPLNDRLVLRSFQEVPKTSRHSGNAHALSAVSGNEAGGGHGGGISESARLRDGASAGYGVIVSGVLVVVGCLVSAALI